MCIGKPRDSFESAAKASAIRPEFLTCHLPNVFFFLFDLTIFCLFYLGYLYDNTFFLFFYLRFFFFGSLHFAKYWSLCWFMNRIRSRAVTLPVPNARWEVRTWKRKYFTFTSYGSQKSYEYRYSRANRPRTARAGQTTATLVCLVFLACRFFFSSFFCTKQEEVSFSPSDVAAYVSFTADVADYYWKRRGEAVIARRRL